MKHFLKIFAVCIVSSFFFAGCTIEPNDYTGLDRTWSRAASFDGSTGIADIILNGDDALICTGNTTDTGRVYAASDSFSSVRQIVNPFGSMVCRGDYFDGKYFLFAAGTVSTQYKGYYSTDLLNRRIV